MLTTHPFGGETLAEFDLVDALGHDISISAEAFTGRPAQVWLTITNYVTTPDGRNTR